MWNKVLTLYEGYIGMGMIAGLFLVAVIYLYVAEKNKTTRIIFLYIPIMILILYFCPFFAAVIYKLAGEEIYYRLLWLVPIVPVLAYTAVKIISGCEGRKRIWTGLAMSGMVILSGSLVYQSPYFSKAQNVYHVPQTVVEICDEIKMENQWVMAVFPSEFIQYVRQYEPMICMPYGREMLVERWNFEEEFFDLMEAETLDAGKIAEKAKEWRCLYIIVPVSKQQTGNFLDFEYEQYDEINGYYVYRDMGLYQEKASAR
ncbi:MAG TPA: hypothetical protein VJY54_07530 [Lachnospiraceae bacterium]|nr:hypothetical protein [Lachnospiraceae bacterium]